MPWPTSQDYNEAIQLPTANFLDPDLRRGEVVCNAMGMPVPRSGNFADVYEVRSPDGNRWAVKCFTREVPGLRERYQEISRHLRAAKLPFTVDFNYLDQGIRVAGRWYAVLKMQWVEGLTLNQFVAQSLDKPVMLAALLQVWVRMAKYLRSAEVAHCDLQHGNVLLVPGSTANALALKLIDYDGMWVPSLAGKASGEAGHPSYQHPQRLREGIYDRLVDRFPLLLIATALQALGEKGRISWAQFDNGDNLLFKESDLQSPTKSVLFSNLLRSKDPRTVTLARNLFDSLRADIEATPLLEAVLPDLIATSPTPSHPDPVRKETIRERNLRPNGEQPIIKPTKTQGTKKSSATHPRFTKTNDTAPPRTGRSRRTVAVVVLAAVLTALVPAVSYWFLGFGNPLAHQHVSTEGIVQVGNPLSRTTEQEVVKPDHKPDTRPDTGRETRPEPESKNLPVRDMAGVFSPEAVKKANENIVELKKKHKRDLIVETFPEAAGGQSEKVAAMSDGDRAAFFIKWGQENIRVQHVDGIYVLFCRNPGYLTIQQPMQGDPVLRDGEPTELLNRMRTLFNGGKYDSALELAVTFFGDTLAKNKAPILPVKPAPEVARGKLPVPSEKDQAANRESVKDVYKDEYKKSDTASLQILANKLLQRGIETKSPHAMQFVLLCEARDLFARSGDSTGAMSAIEQLANLYAIDEPTQRNDALDALVNAVTANKDLASIAELSVSLSEAAIREDSYGLAAQYLAKAEMAARKTQDLALVAKIQTKAKWVEETGGQYRAVAPLVEKLKEKSDDLEANLRVGKFYCFVKSDWSKGPTYLLHGPQGKLRALAVIELANPEGLAGQLELADGWRELAEGEAPPDKRSLQLRAYHWYQQALLSVEAGAEREGIEKRIDALLAVLPELNSPLELRAFAGHTDKVLCAVFSPNGRQVFSGGKDSTVRLWDAESGKEVKKAEWKTESVETLSFSQDDSVILVGTLAHSEGDKKCKVQVTRWDFAAGKSLSAMASERDYTPNLSPLLAVTPGSGQAVVAETKSLANGFTLCNLDFANLGNVAASRLPFPEMNATASCIAIHPDGSMILTGGTAKDQVLRLWDLEKRKVVSMGGPTTGVRCVAISANGKRGLSGGVDKKIQVWDLTNGKIVTTLSGHSGAVTCVSFSPDGTRLLSGSEDKTVRLWDVKSGKEVCRFSGHTDVVHCVAFSPDGWRGLSAGDTSVRLYRLPR